MVSQKGVSIILIGTVAVVATMGLVSLSSSLTGAYGHPPGNPKPYVLQTGPLLWQNMFAIADTMEDSLFYCPNHKISEGGFLDVLQKSGARQFRCFAVPIEVMPFEYQQYYVGVGFKNPDAAPVACFLEQDRVPPEGFSYPIHCTSGIYMNPYEQEPTSYDYPIPYEQTT